MLSFWVTIEILEVPSVAFYHHCAPQLPSVLLVDVYDSLLHGALACRCKVKRKSLPGRSLVL
uniref:Uncharacterized protein n=1 Tax=Physcomitrium patens TaxID=3218 RepID=A0A2K1JLU8_PHYPA|nr:hypothetical protein PHYPA_017329 [Physcomitrium patens]